MHKCQWCEDDAPGHPPEVFTAIEAVLTTVESPVVPITVGGLGRWEVPRAYIGFHGIKAAELPALAERWGWHKLQRSA